MDDVVQLATIILLGTVFFGIAIFWNEHVGKKKLRSRLKMQFGKIPEREYDLDEYDNISRYYRKSKKDGFVIDDITWGDLDMDTLFPMVNNTQSSAGQEYLYALLRKPELSGGKLKRRKEIMDYFASHEEERLDVQMVFAKMGRMHKFSLADYMELMGNLDLRGGIKHYVCLGALFAALGLLFINIPLGVCAFLVVLTSNMLFYFRRKADMEPYLQTMQYILRLFRGGDQLAAMSIPELTKELDEIRSIKKRFRGFRIGSGLVTSTSPTGGIEQIVLDYLKMILHIDFIRFYQMMKYMNQHMDGVEQLIAALGFLDGMIAAASFREALPSYSIPVLRHDRKAKMILVGGYHPMLQEPVKNSIREDQNILLTGSNASGKSTFLKMVAINALFSQTLYISFSKEYEANYFRIFTSMALKDNLLNHESYYIVEIKSLKRILDASKDGTPMLCFVDEVLRGTNTVERIAASVEILKSISQEHVMCFAATHDIELTHLLEDCFCNYHFTETIVDQDIQFDYHLYRGRATSRNAIKLLGLMGYDRKIIERAEKRTHDLEKV